MNQSDQFKHQCDLEIAAMGRNLSLRDLSDEWIAQSGAAKYTYHFEWLGRPIIQYPQDMVALQELIWVVRPDLIIETGIAHGGSLILSASMLALLDYCEAVESGEPLDPQATRRLVVGIDIDIREHNRRAIERHPMAHRIRMIQGSSVDPDVISRVKQLATGHERILVCLDSNHTCEHVLAELNAYASLVSVDSYCIVFDTVIEDMPDDSFSDRPWGKDDNPKTAVRKFLESCPEFEVDKSIDHKLLISVAPDGYLKRRS